jgi:hypothetical protein
MSQRTGSFEDFKNHTLAVARGEHKVHPGEPKIWREKTAKPLKDFSIGDLQEARQRIEETEKWVKRKSEERPGPGWAHVSDRLRDNRAAVEAEITRRVPP